jgi:hypothetical protein
MPGQGSAVTTATWRERREEAQGREEQILNLQLRHLALDLEKQQIADYSAAANS